MNELLDNIDDNFEEIFFEKLPTKLPESPLRTLEEEDLFQFKKRLFKNTRIFKAESLTTASEDLFDTMYWQGEIESVNRSGGDLIVGKDGRRIQEFAIDCLIDYVNRGINSESTPAFVLYYALQDMGYDFNEKEKAKIALYEDLYRVFSHTRG